jgi:hypothetical protein
MSPDQPQGGTPASGPLRGLSRIPEWGQAAALYTLLAIVFTLPLFTAPWRLTPGEYFDIWGCLWTGDWFRHALPDPDVALLRSEVTGYPFGIPLRQLDSWIWALASVPLTALFGTVMGLNVFVLGSLTFSGVCLYLLARRCGVSHASSLVAGSLLVSSACASALFAEGAVYLLMTGWIPLCCLFLLDLLAGRGRWSWLKGALCLAAAGYTSGYLGVCAAIACVLVVLSSAPRLRRGRVLAGVAAMAVAAAVALVPLMMANRSLMGSDRMAMDRFVVDADGATRREHTSWLANVPRDATTVRSLIVPPGMNRSDSPTPRERTSYLGLLPLLLAALGFVALPWRMRAVWAALAAGGLFLMFGPVLQWDHAPFGHPVPRDPALPMAWVYYWVPGAQVFRFPYRFAILAMVALAVPLGAGLDWLRSRLRAPLGLAIGTLVLAEVLLVSGGPVLKPVHRLEPEPWYEAIRDGGGQGAVLELGNENMRYKARRIYGQTLHGRPVPDEFPVYVSMPTAGFFHAVMAQRIAHAEGRGTRQLTPERFRWLLDELHFDWVVHHHHSFRDDDALAADERERWTAVAAAVLTDDLGPGIEYPQGVTLYRVSETFHDGPLRLDPPVGNQRDRMLNGHVVSVFEALLTEQGGELASDPCPECDETVAPAQPAQPPL